MTEDQSLDVNANIVNTPPGNCFFCGQETVLLCRFCQRVYYCSEVTLRHERQEMLQTEHFQEHLGIHRSSALQYCYPFIVKTHPELGR